MKKRLIGFLILLVCASTLFAQGTEEASDKVWPKTQPVVYIGFGAGGGTDTSVRPVIAKMEEYLGETINVVNQSGASSAVAANNVIHKPHDGYSMFATGSGAFSGFRVNGTSDTYWADWASFHPFTGPAVLVVRADSELQDFDDVVARLKGGDVINFAISGFGVGPHVLFDAIRSEVGAAQPNYITSGSCNKAGVSVIAGDAEMAMATFGSVIDFIKAGQLRAVAITSDHDYTKFGLNIPAIVSLIPNSDYIPMLSETWPIMIPRDTPAPMLEKIKEAFLWAIEQDEIVTYAETMGYELCGYTGEEADKFYAIQESGYSWAQWNSGMVENDPAKIGIPTLEEFDWEQMKAQIK